MPAISRQSAKIFASNAPVGQVTAFRTTETTPQTTKAPDQIQNENYLQGWLNADGSGNVLPYAEDMNGLFYTLSYNTAYLYEKGIPEYSSTQTYYLNSFCQYSGKIYRCKGDSVINIAPTNTNYWDALPSSSYTATTVGAGTTNYGTVYAGTDTAGTQFQFKTIIGGSNVTITETADSLTISSTGGGGGASFIANAPLSYNNGVLSIPAATSSQSGYLTAADWTSFNSKLSSTIFSSANTWSAKNTFSADIDANAIYTTRLKTPYSSSYGSHINHYYTDSNNTETLWLVDGYDNSFSNLGLFPQTNTAKLGLSGTPWGTGYIDTIYTNDVYARGLTSITFHNNLVPVSTGASLGGTNNKWTAGWFASCTIGASGINPVDDQKTLGATTYWKTGYINEVVATSITPKPNETTNIGGSSTRWGSVYATNLNANGTVTFNSISTNGDNLYNIGGSGARFANVWSHTFRYSDKVQTYSEGNNFFLEWYSTTSSTSRTIFLVDDEFVPFQDNAISFGSPTRRWYIVYSTNGVSQSDREGKENIESLESGLDIIKKLPVYSFTWKDHNDLISYGTIAQEALEVAPEIVNVPKNYKEGDGSLGIYTNNVIFLTVRAIQELSAKVDDLQQQLMELKK